MKLEMKVILAHEHILEGAGKLYTAKLYGEFESCGFLLEATTNKQAFKLDEKYNVTIAKAK